MTEPKGQKRIMLASTGSGRGKTMITSGLLQLLKEQFDDVHAFKCGPDYIDPMYHSAVLKIPSKNLDPFFCDEDLLRASFFDGAGEINIIESCMGLYDGLGVSSECSSYSVAAALKCPIILIIDGQGMGYSIIPQIKGFLSMDTEGLIKGIFLDRVSENYFNKLKPVIEAETGLKVIGFLPALKDINLDSRHLGLKMVDENNGLEKIAAVSERLKETLDLPAFLESLKAEELEIKKQLKDYVCENLTGSVIAVAKDQAFNFYYEDNIKALELSGARVIYFSPLEDEKIPDEATALYIGGGYPELHLKQLEENASMRQSVLNFARTGKPVVAECGGYMYLNKTIDGHSMAGFFDGNAVKKKGLVRFGYADAKGLGYELKVHEFHHYDLEDPGQEFELFHPGNQLCYRAIHKSQRTIAGFPHFYFFSDMRFLKEFK